jgi:hypothetical protein
MSGINLNNLIKRNLLLEDGMSYNTLENLLIIYSLLMRIFYPLKY